MNNNFCTVIKVVAGSNRIQTEDTWTTNTYTEFSEYYVSFPTCQRVVILVHTPLSRRVRCTGFAYFTRPWR